MGHSDHFATYYIEDSAYAQPMHCSWYNYYPPDRLPNYLPGQWEGSTSTVRPRSLTRDIWQNLANVCRREVNQGHEPWWCGGDLTLPVLIFCHVALGRYNLLYVFVPSSEVGDGHASGRLSNMSSSRYEDLGTFSCSETGRIGDGGHVWRGELDIRKVVRAILSWVLLPLCELVAVILASLHIAILDVAGVLVASVECARGRSVTVVWIGIVGFDDLSLVWMDDSQLCFSGTYIRRFEPWFCWAGTQRFTRVPPLTSCTDLKGNSSHS